MTHTNLYHKNLGFPTNVQNNIRTSGQIRPEYSNHAFKRSCEYGFELPEVIDYSTLRPFEIEATKDGHIVKIGFRMDFDFKDDLILIIQPNNNFVRTVWLNDKRDEHKTLDDSKYTVVNGMSA